jgi:hypothetical protein
MNGTQESQRLGYVQSAIAHTGTQKKYRKIPLTRGRFTIVDEDDYERLSKHKWCTSIGSHYLFYAHRCITGTDGKRYMQKMHREILGLKNGDGQIVDHINGDSLDNRKINLRIVDKTTNNINRKRHKNSNSGYKGVYPTWNKKMWMAKIRINGELILLGSTFATKEEAALVYDNAFEKYRGFNNYPNIKK